MSFNWGKRFLYGVSGFKWILWVLWPCCLNAQASELPINTRLGGDFALSSTHDGVSKLSDLRGKIVLLNFGYTSCPDICPMVVARMSQVLRQMQADGVDNIAGVFVTFDPARDSVAHLREYLRFFDSNIIGFSGDPMKIAAIAKSWGVVFVPQEGESALGTMYSHTDFIYLLDRQGRVRALYGKEQALDKILADVQCLRDED
jgi:protein SCO1/2